MNKKIIASLLAAFISSSLTYPVYANTDESYIYEIPTTVEDMLEQENTFQTSLTEQEFVTSLEEQGFSVRKEKTIQFYSVESTNTYYTIEKPLTTLACPRGVGTVPGTHYINAVYSTINGWNYFVSFNGSGVALATSNYTKESENSNILSIDYGGQGVTWITTLQYEYSVSNSIAVNVGWGVFGGSAGIGNTIHYRTGLVTEQSSFHFPLMG